MTRVLAIDPGPLSSAWLVYDKERRTPLEWAYEVNDEVLISLSVRELSVSCLAIEHIQHYGRGMPVGADVFETCIWMGRFIGAFDAKPWVLIKNPTIRACLCNNASANARQIKQALIDKFGGKDKAIGGVKCPKCKRKGWVGRNHATCPVCEGALWAHPPGPLHDMTEHIWSALAVAVCWSEQHAH